MLVNINDDKALDMLMDRLKFWADDATTLELFEKMYEDYIDEGVFENGEFDVMKIVDNDYVNWCDVIYKGDENFDRLIELYDDGEHDVSCENVGCSFIESINDDRTAILVRW